jgi:unsaturated chondroitin disaccharide hydrolase
MKSFIVEKTRANGEIFQDKLMCLTVDGKYRFIEDGFWTGSFWTGLNYLCYEMTEDKTFIDSARKSWHRFIKRLYEKPGTLDHDIGFLYILSFVADYKLTGNKESRKIALDAVDLLMSRFNEKGQFIQAWNVWKEGDPFSEENRGRIIIDCMYNIPLLYWAHKETGNENYYRVATAHATTCLNTIIREDYTTYHTYVFDHVTGEPKYGRTCQGYSDESTWSRGQSWAIGGYAYAYRYTGEKKFLETAIGVTDVFIKNLEEDNISMYDFTLPTKEGEPRDSSATAIAAAGMLELCEYVDEDKKKYYMSCVEKMLESLYENYSTKDMPTEQGILLHACGAKPKPGSIDTDCSLIFGDYYFAEAVARLSGKYKLYW